MPLLIERIKVLRPYLTAVQAELICSELRATASNEEVINAVLPLEGLSLGVSESLADYVHRHQLDDHLTVREFWSLSREIDKMYHEGHTMDEMRIVINERIGIA